MTESDDDDEEEATRAPLILEVAATTIPDIDNEARSEAARQLALHAGVRAEEITFNADIESVLKEADPTMKTATALSFADEVHDAAVEFLTSKMGANGQPAAPTVAAAQTPPAEARAELVEAVTDHAIAVWKVKVGGRDVLMIVSEMGSDGDALRKTLETHKGHKATMAGEGERVEEAAAYANAAHPLTVVCREVGPMAAAPKKLRGLPMQKIEEDIKAQLAARLVDNTTRDSVDVWRKEITRPGTKGGSMPNAIDSAIITLATQKPMKNILIEKDEQPPDPKRGLMQLPRVTLKVGVLTMQSAFAAKKEGAKALAYETRDMPLFDCAVGASRPAIHVPGMMLGVHGATMITDRSTSVDIVQQHKRAQARLRESTWPIYKKYCECEYEEAGAALGEKVKTPLEEVCSLGILKTIVHYKDPRRGDTEAAQCTQPCQENGCRGRSFTCYGGEAKLIPGAVVQMLEASIAAKKAKGEETGPAEHATAMPEPRQPRGSGKGKGSESSKGKGSGSGKGGGKGGGKGDGGVSGTPPQAREARGQCGRCGRQKATPAEDGTVPDRMCDGMQCATQSGARAKARGIAARMQAAATKTTTTTEADGAGEADAALSRQDGGTQAQAADGRDAQEALTHAEGGGTPAKEGATRPEGDAAMDEEDGAPIRAPEAPKGGEEEDEDMGEASTAQPEPASETPNAAGGVTAEATEVAHAEAGSTAEKAAEKEREEAELEAMNLEETASEIEKAYQERVASGEISSSAEDSRSASRSEKRKERDHPDKEDGPSLATVEEGGEEEEDQDDEEDDDDEDVPAEKKKKTRGRRAVRPAGKKKKSKAKTR